MFKNDSNIDIREDEWQASLPYNALPMLPPKGVDLETKAILKQCIAARAALGELKLATQLLPNQMLLINALRLLEAKASSEIENIVTTVDELFKHANDEHRANPATKETLRYGHALFQGYKNLDKHPLSTRTTEMICSQIKGVDMTVRRTPGTRLINNASNEIIYTPPDTEIRLRELLSNWEQFLHNDRHGQPLMSPALDPLIVMAVAHYQFEAIHPFSDGNGRTGRIINSLFLIQEQLLTLPILYLSRYIIAHKRDYYRLLLAVTKAQDWEPWVMFMLKGVEETALWTIEKISSIKKLQEDTVFYLKLSAPKIYTHELVQVLFWLPYCRISDLVSANIAKRQTSSEYLKRLCEIGILQEQDAGKEKIFKHAKLMQLLSSENHLFEPYPTI